MSIMDEVKKEGVVIARKWDWQVWLHYIVPVFWAIAGLLFPREKKNFEERAIINLGKHIYFNDPDHVNANLPRYRPTFVHELVHIKDNKRRPLFYKITYVLSKKWRCYWEFRAYSQEMVFRYKDGEIPPDYIDFLVEVFSDSFYFNMHDNLRPAFERVADLASNGNISRFEFPEEFEVLAKEEIFS